ncbi:MAG: DUF1232 domain-containing protein [Chlorobiales bacterium]|nr:DUF1232 domain-containing protein [Chlorobiales bacterium]
MANDEIKNDAMNSGSFHRAKSKAEDYARDPKKAKKLIDEAAQKSEENKGVLGDVWTYLQALIRMVKAYYSRSYTQVPWKSLLIGIAGLIYFVSPIDAIFDYIPVLGLIDDAAVLSAVISAIRYDLNNFIAWESLRDHASRDRALEVPYEEIKNN